jgi:hypothetical protein
MGHRVSDNAAGNFVIVVPELVGAISCSQPGGTLTGVIFQHLPPTAIVFRTVLFHHSASNTRERRQLGSDVLVTLHEYRHASIVRNKGNHILCCRR